MIDFLVGIFEFLISLVGFIFMLLESLLKFILMIPQFMTVTTDLFTFSPDYIQPFLILSLAVMVLMVIIGR